MNHFIARRIIHPLLFLLRGERVFRRFSQLQAAQWQDPGITQKRQMERIQGLVSLAVSRFPSYASLLSELGISPSTIQSPDDIGRLPILEKEDIRQFVQELRNSPGRLPVHDIRKSGGSTGAPSIVLADRIASESSLAARVLCQGWHGINVGDRQIRFWGRPLSPGLRKEKLKDFLLNRIRLDSLIIDNSNLKMTLEKLKKFNPDYFYGYASLIQLFADNASTENLASFFPRLKAVISTSETLTSAQMKNLSTVFNCPVLNEYGCSEVDIIAFTCEQGGLHVIAENLLVEVVAFPNDPPGFGQIVVTDLNNRLFPVIRYLVGDLASQKMIECSCGRTWPCLQGLLGRSQGQYILLPGQGRLHSQFVVYAIEELANEGVPIARFRIIQEKLDELTLEIAPSLGAEINTEFIRNFLLKKCHELLGGRISWNVQQVGQMHFEGTRTNKFMHFESRIEK